MSTKSSGKWSRSKTVKKIMSTRECTSIVEGLKIIYFTKASRPFAACFDCTPRLPVVLALKDVLRVQIRPLEEAYKFGDFFSSYLNESDFHAKPSVLLLGQYSTGAADCTPSYLHASNNPGELLAQWPSLPAGKTTFIKHLLKREYPGIHIGPEPTTDRFVVVMSGMEERRTPGNSLIVMPDRPFQVTPCSAHAQDDGNCAHLRPSGRAAHPLGREGSP